MSWSVSSSGSPQEVASKLAEQFKGPHEYLTGPEKDICQSADELIKKTIVAYEGRNVSVQANGHAGIDGDKKYQVLSIRIDPTA